MLKPFFPEKITLSSAKFAQRMVKIKLVLLATQLVECPLCMWEVMGLILILIQVISSLLFNTKTRKMPNGIMNRFLQDKESVSCLSCMWHAYGSSSSSLPNMRSSSSSLPNMKVIHWSIKVTYNFEIRLTKRDGPMPAPPPRHCYFNGWIFLKTHPKIGVG